MNQPGQPFRSSPGRSRRTLSRGRRLLASTPLAGPARTARGRLRELAARRRLLVRPTARERTLLAARPELVFHRGMVRYDLADRTPAEATAENLALVAGVLESARIPYVLLRPLTPMRTVVAVSEEHRGAVLVSLAAAAEAEPLRAQAIGGDRNRRHVDAREVSSTSAFAEADVVRCARLYVHATQAFGYGLGHGCDVEFYTSEESPNGEMVRFPRPNAVGLHLPKVLLEPRPVEVGGRTYPQAEVMQRTLLEDVDVPVDLVYTWVDGDDPAWRERMARARAASRGVPYHPISHHDARFRSRDELRYSLRSVAMYAPWVRRIFLVTDEQRPEWLAEDARLAVVPHRDIFTDTSVLPVFNSSAIISQLHHIDGLAEHYVYVNDDVFFGRSTTRATFFTPSGQARIFPSRNARPFGAATEVDEPHFNLTRNMRTLIEAEYGRTVTHAVKHTPHAQLRSVQYALEERFAADYSRTSASTFRSHTDIAADQFFHYVGQLLGHAVPSPIRYDYVNLANEEYLETLERLLRRRDRDVFCLNDAPAPDLVPMAPEVVARFLEQYFPVTSPWEVVRKP